MTQDIADIVSPEVFTCSRSDLEFVVEIANRNEQSAEGDRLAAMLAASSDCEPDPLWDALRVLTSKIDKQLAKIDKLSIDDEGTLKRLSDAVNDIDEANFNAKAVLMNDRRGALIDEKISVCPEQVRS